MSNIVKFIILGLLLISIPLTVKLAQERQIFKPKAATVSCTSNCTFPQQDSDGQTRCYKGTMQDNVCKYDDCVGSQEVPCSGNPTATPTPGGSCGPTCTFSQLDTDGQTRCYQGTCTNASCGFNQNCEWNSSCNNTNPVDCPSGSPTVTPTPGGGCTSNCTFPQQDADGQVRCYKGTTQESVCKYDPCVGTQEVPCQSTKTATLTSSCPSSTATLTATWDVGTGVDCNAYIQAGTTPHVISSDCKGTKSVTDTWVVNGGTYTLHVGDPGGQTTSSTQTTIACGNVTPGTSNTKLYIEPATFGTGQSVSVLATGSTSCSTGLVDVATFGAGITGCTRGGGFTCSGNPKNDGNPCWYKWNCTAGPAGSYTAKFNASGSNCLSTANYTVTSTTVTASPTVPPNTRTLLFKFAETREGLDQARYQPYDQHPITVPHTFSSTPGDKWIYVRFKLSDGSERDVNPVKIKLLGPDPAFTNISCQDNPTGVGTQVTLKGTDFGDRGASSVLLNNRITEITSWTAPSATTSAALYKVVAKTADKYNEGTSLPVKLTIDDGRSVAGTCVTSTPIVDYAIKIPCQPVGNIATLNVRVQIYEDKDSPKPLYDQSITFDQNNKPKWTAPKLEIGKSYQIVVKAPGTLAIRKPFVADEGTTVLDNITLPVGDIFPPASPDSLINTFDKAELVRQWTATNDVLRSGDFNKDSRVNSIDYSCMLTGFNAPSSQFLKGK